MQAGAYFADFLAQTAPASDHACTSRRRGPVIRQHTADA